MSSLLGRRDVGLLLMAAPAVAAGCWFFMLRQQRRRQKDSEFPVEYSYTEFSDLVLPSLCSKDGMMYAGQFLSVLDIVGGICAFKHCHGPIVTVTIDSVRFLAPAFAHDALLVSGRVNAVFRSSVEIEVVIEKEHGGNRTVCCKGRLVFVHLDPRTKRPLKCPALKLQTNEEEARSQAAVQRKEERAAERREGLSADAWWKQQWPQEEANLLQQIEAATTTTPNDTQIEFIETTPENSHRYTATTNKVIMPQHANTLQIAFGGQVMFWMEQAAGLAAVRFTQNPAIITASLDRMSFQTQAKVGDLLSIEARVVRAFDKSLEVKVHVYCMLRDPRQSGSMTKPAFCNAGFFTFTALDPNTQRPVTVGKQIRPVTEEAQQDFCEALRRREARLKEPVR